MASMSGFDLMTCDLYFKIQVDVFTNHVSPENIYFSNYIE